MMTEEQGLRLLKLVHELKAVAMPVGSLHAWWDFVMDADAFVKGRPTIVQRTADEWISEAERMLCSQRPISSSSPHATPVESTPDRGEDIGRSGPRK